MYHPAILSLLPLFSIVAPIRDIRNKISTTLAFNNFNLDMVLGIVDVEMVDNCVINSIIYNNCNSYNEVRGHTLMLSMNSSYCYGTLNTNNFLFYFLLFFLILLFFFFILFSWKDDEEGTWQGSHMTCHIVWCHKPKTWWKGLEDDVRAHGIHMVALSRTWGRNEDEA